MLLDYQKNKKEKNCCNRKNKLVDNFGAISLQVMFIRITLERSILGKLAQNN